MEPAKGFVLLSFIQKTFCNIAFLFLSQNAGMICFLMISIKLTAQVPFLLSFHCLEFTCLICYIFYIFINK